MFFLIASGQIQVLNVDTVIIKEDGFVIRNILDGKAIRMLGNDKVVFPFNYNQIAIFNSKTGLLIHKIVLDTTIISRLYENKRCMELSTIPLSETLQIIKDENKPFNRVISISSYKGIIYIFGVFYSIQKTDTDTSQILRYCFNPYLAAFDSKLKLKKIVNKPLFLPLSKYEGGFCFDGNYLAITYRFDDTISLNPVINTFQIKNESLNYINTPTYFSKNRSFFEPSSFSFFSDGNCIVFQPNQIIDHQIAKNQGISISLNFPGSYSNISTSITYISGQKVGKNSYLVGFYANNINLGKLYWVHKDKAVSLHEFYSFENKIEDLDFYQNQFVLLSKDESHYYFINGTIKMP